MRKDDAMDATGNRVMGIGCFAGQQTLSRVLGRLMQAYSLGGWADAMRMPEGASAGCLALRNLIFGNPDMAGQDGDGLTGEKITGFFLMFENRRLSLSVFLQRQGMRSRKFTASLDELACLRRSRLH
jgi:hypothetical protein